MQSRKAKEALPEYVRRVRREKKLSTTDVEVRSNKGISDAYVTRIENGYVKNVSPEKLKALALGLGELEEKVFAVARGKAESDTLPFDELRLLEGYRRIKPELRAAALAQVELMAQMHGAEESPQPRMLETSPLSQRVAIDAAPLNEIDHRETPKARRRRRGG